MVKVISIMANILMIISIIFIVSLWRKKGVKPKDKIGIKWSKHSWVDILSGVIIGFIAMLGVFLVENRFSLISIKDINIGKLSVLVAAQILVMAALEEFAFRGLMLNGLIELTKNKYIAVLISAVIFGMAHAGNPHATFLSIISNSLGGVMYAIAYLESKSLYLPVALHFSWNFFQGPIFGFPLNGLNFSGMISQSIISKNVSLMGGMYGPEGGIIGIGFRFLVIALTVVYAFLVLRRSKGLSCK